MSSIKLFESKKIRSVWNNTDHKWYFSVQDVLEILMGSVNVKDYIKKLRNRDVLLDSNWRTIYPPVEIPAADGKMRKIQAANAEGLFRIIQSVLSPKAEQFKHWLAKVGFVLTNCFNPSHNEQKAQRILQQRSGIHNRYYYKRSIRRLLLSQIL